MLTTEQLRARDLALDHFIVDGDWDAFMAALDAAGLVAEEGSDEGEIGADFDEINAELALAADVDRGIIS